MKNAGKFSQPIAAHLVNKIQTLAPILRFSPQRTVGNFALSFAEIITLAAFEGAEDAAAGAVDVDFVGTIQDRESVV